MSLVTMTTNLGRTIKAFAYNSGLVKHAPKILLGLGISSVVGGTVIACKQTLNMDTILDEHEKTVNDIKELRETSIELQEEEPIDDSIALDFYTEKAMKKDLVKTYIRTGGKIMKNYAVPVSLIGGGIISIVSSHNILNTRYTTALAAYNVLSDKFSEYRKRVIDDYGQEVDDLYSFGFDKKEELVETKNKKGTVKKKLETSYSPRPEGLSEFAIMFGPETSTMAIRPVDTYGDGYERNTINAIRTKNLEFLINTQAQCNDRLKREGHLFLNDIYRMLGMLFKTEDGRYTSDRACGALNGWIYRTDKDGNYIGPGDGYVDFKIFDVDGELINDNFVDGYKENIWIDFNCDGKMYHLLNDSFRGPAKRVTRRAHI